MRHLDMAADGGSQHELRDKLVFSTVDKVVFGLLIAFAGLVLNLVLENYRSGQETRQEIARLRVDRVAAVARALDEAQIAIESYTSDVAETTAVADAALVRALETGLVRPEPSGEIGASIDLLSDRRAKDISRKQQNAERVLNENRFWIGERAFPEYHQFARRQYDMLVAAQFLMLESNWRVYAPRTHVLLPSPGELPRIKRMIQPLPQSSRRKLEALHRQYQRRRADLTRVRAQLEESRVDVFTAMKNLE